MFYSYTWTFNQNKNYSYLIFSNFLKIWIFMLHKSVRKLRLIIFDKVNVCSHFTKLLFKDKILALMRCPKLPKMKKMTLN